MKITAITSVFLIALSINLPVQADKILAAGFDEAPPYHYKGADGRVIGSDVDILHNTLEKISRTVKYEELPWTRTLAYIKSGDIDIAFGSSHKEERAQWAHFSTPYKSITHSLYTRDADQLSIDSLDEFFKKGLRVVVVIGWNYTPEIRSILDKPEYAGRITKVASFAQLPKMLVYKRVDGIIANSGILEAEIKKSSLTLTEFKKQCTYEEKLHFIFSKKSISPDFVKKFNTALTETLLQKQSR